MATAVIPLNNQANDLPKTLAALEQRFAPPRTWIMAHVALFVLFTAIGTVGGARFDVTGALVIGAFVGFLAAVALFWNESLFFGVRFIVVVRDGKIAQIERSPNLTWRYYGADIVISVMAPGVFQFARIDLASANGTLLDCEGFWTWLDIDVDRVLIARRYDGMKARADTVRGLVERMVVLMDDGHAA